MIEYVIISVSLVITALAVAWGFRQRKKVAAVMGDNVLQNERIVAQNEQLAVLNERLAVQAAQYGNLDSILKKERAELTEKFSKDFSILANDILEQKSRSMTQTARESIFSLLQPLGDNLKEFREKIDTESKHRFALQGEVKRLAELNEQMNREAQNLTRALKGNSKSQGDWGEMILLTLLESSGLEQDIHFKVQHNIKTEDGKNLRPDVVLMMPEGKQVVIDSKVSLTAYVAYTEAADDTVRERVLAAHIKSLRDHISELGAKRYDTLIGSSPDFVIMFVPNEPALLLGLQAYDAMWGEAYAKGVILSSPTNLFGILRIVADLWRRDLQSKSAIEIARQGGELYDKFVNFAQTFTEVGKAIDKASEAHEKAMNQLNSGKGNLVTRTEKLRELGIKVSKNMPRELESELETEAETEAEAQNML